MSESAWFYTKTRMVGLLVMALEKRYPRWLVERLPIVRLVEDMEAIIEREECLNRERKEYWDSLDPKHREQLTRYFHGMRNWLPQFPRENP